MQADKTRRLYFILGGGGIASFIAVLLLYNVDAARWLVMEHNFSWQFSDFFRQIIYASDLKNIYFNTSDAPFPPLAYLFFHILYRMNPTDAPIDLSSWILVQENQYNPLIFLIFMAVTIIFLVDILRKIIALGEVSSLLFALLVLFSAPFMSGAVERGNIALVVCVLILWALYFKESETPWKRELALILIALSAGLKIYPAVFGLIYVKEKRWHEAGKLILYGIIFFFLPFAFTGGFAGLAQYVKVLHIFENAVSYRWTNIRNFGFALSRKYGYGWNFRLAMILENIYLAVCLATMFRTGKNWKRILLLAGIMATYVPNSHRYVSIYMLIPFAFWFRQQTGRWNDYIYCILFSLTFTIPTYAYFINKDVDFCIFAPIYFTLIYAIAETWLAET